MTADLIALIMQAIKDGLSPAEILALAEAHQDGVA